MDVAIGFVLGLSIIHSKVLREQSLHSRRILAYWLNQKSQNRLRWL